jgi:uncharacterized membrane protein
MASGWEEALAKWQDAGLIDPEAAARIREFEGRETGSGRLRWPAIAAISLGGMMLAAGVFLFVSAHWEEIAPSTRFALVVGMVAIFHGAGAYAGEKMEALAAVLHGIGTAALGAGIYLSGQIFNMSEHWPSAILMWAVGALIAWWLRRDWLQLSFAAILTPAWVGAEWVETHPAAEQIVFRVLCQGMVLLAITYFTALERRWRPLVWIGGLALLPWTAALILSHDSWFGRQTNENVSIPGYAVAYGGPLILSYLLRGKQAWINGVAAVWVVVLNMVLNIFARESSNPLIYLWCGVGAAGLVAWGMYERRGERVNLGMAAFAITILCFYFSSVMDKLGRSASLIGLGVLFLAGGWALERLRRKLVAQMRAA